MFFPDISFISLFLIFIPGCFKLQLVEILIALKKTHPFFFFSILPILITGIVSIANMNVCLDLLRGFLFQTATMIMN